ncbi:MAG TPA: hypothetical protein VMU95_14900 [Trebonia sp.]|nr:hypothetical protein [Trebonia sp.]
MNRRRALTLATLPVVMAAGVVGGQAALASTTQPAKPAQTCILGIICLGGGGSSSSPKASPSPTYSLPTCLPTALPTPLPSLPADILKKLKALPQCLASALPTKLPSVPGLPTSLPTVPGLPTSLPGGAGVPTVPGLPGSGGSGTGSGKGKSSAKDPKAKNTNGGPGLVAPAAISVLSGNTATLVDFTYRGNAKLPTAAGGTVTMMKFTASSLTLSGHAEDVVTEAGVTATTSSPTMALNGNVVLYATKLSGTLDGIPLTFTPTTISGLLLRVANVITGHGTITMTSVSTDQALATADQLTYEPTFSVSLS